MMNEEKSCASRHAPVEKVVVNTLNSCEFINFQLLLLSKQFLMFFRVKPITYLKVFVMLLRGSSGVKNGMFVSLISYARTKLTSM